MYHFCETPLEISKQSGTFWHLFTLPHIEFVTLHPPAPSTSCAREECGSEGSGSRGLQPCRRLPRVFFYFPLSCFTFYLLSCFFLHFLLPRVFLDTQVSLAPTHVSKLVGWLVRK